MDGDFMSDLYNNIHALCEKENIKDGTLCSKVGVTRSTLSELKRGRTTSLSLKNLQKIADYFGVSISDLTGEAPEQKEKPSGLPAGLDATQYTPEQLEVLNAVTKKIQTEEGCQDMYNLLKAMHIL